MKKIFYVVGAIILFTSFLSVKSAEANTVLDSEINGEVHLMSSGSPYIAPEEGLNLRSTNASLIIDPGVTIIFPEYAGLYIEKGKLVIMGENNNKVILKGENGLTWQGLLINKASADIRSLQIFDAYVPIKSENSTTTIHDLILDGDDNTNPETFGYGIHLVKSTTTMSSSTISDFRTAGIYQQGGTSTIRQNIIERNSIGVKFNDYHPPVLVQKQGWLGKIISFIKPQKAHGDNETPSINANQNIINNNQSNVKNLSEESVVDFRHNYWGSEVGPEETVEGNVLTSPWLLAPPVFEVEEEVNECCSSILFIPGFQGTRLKKGGNQLWEPNRNADVEKLYLNSNGESVDPLITVGEIIKKTNIGFSVFDKPIYESFTAFLDGLTQNQTINEWQALPYDWRLDLPISGVIQIIETLAQDSDTGKINIIGHSNGGLMAKKIAAELKRIGKENLIDKIILAAVPQVGAAGAISSLLHGDDQALAGGFILNKATAREFGNNMMGAYNLLPSGPLASASPLISFATSTDRSSPLRQLYGNALNSFEKVKSFLLGILDQRVNPPKEQIEKPAVLKTNLLGKTIDNHGWLGLWKPATSTKLYQIGAFGLPTSNSIEYFSKTYCSQTASPVCTPQFAFTHENKKRNDGDGTVPIKSSLYLNYPTLLFDIGKFDKNTNSSFTHATILETSPIQEAIKKIIKDLNADLPSSYLTYNEDGYDPSLLTNLPVIRRYGVHSPVTLDAYDAEERHTGISRNSDESSDLIFIENEIPGSTYEEVGSDKYIYVSGTEPLQFKMKGTENGLFSFDVQETKNNGENQILASFNDIPVIEGSEATAEVSATTGLPETLNLDVDGNGTNDLIIPKNTPLTTLNYIDIFAEQVNDLQLPAQLRQRLNRAIDRLRILALRNKDEKVIRKLKRFYQILESNNIRFRHLSPADLATLISLLSSTLDALDNNQ